jgi:hypothetical protein
MQIGSIELTHLTFPGRAGELQRKDAVPALVAELGDNYAKYHEFLRARLAEHGTAPAVEDCPSILAYYEAWNSVQELVKSEVILRNCKAYRERGRSLNSVLEQDGVPLVDAEFGLVSNE